MGWGGKGKGASWGDSWGKGGWGKGKGAWGGDGWGVAPAWNAFSKGSDKGKGKGKKNRLLTFDSARRVWLGGIPDHLSYMAPTDEGHVKLKEHLSTAGKCQFISVKKGEGGAAFSTEEEALNAIAILNGSAFEGSVIQVDVWTRKDPK